MQDRHSCEIACYKSDFVSLVVKLWNLRYRNILYLISRISG